MSRLSANIWIDVCSSDTALTFDLWPFTHLLFIITTNHFNWFHFFHFCLFELFITWSLFSLILSYTLLSQIVLVYRITNHLSPAVTQALLFSLGVWMTYTFARTTHSYGLNYRVWHADTEQNVFFIIYDMLNALNDISRYVLYSIWMYFSYVGCVLYRLIKYFFCGVAVVCICVI